MVSHPLNIQVTQAEFGQLVGVSQQAVSEMLKAGVLPPGGTALEWLRAYCERLEESARVRLSPDGPLDLVQERAALAQEQRIAWQIRNAKERAQYAPRSTLNHVLEVAGAAVAADIDRLDGQVPQAVPDLPPAALEVISAVISSARSEWQRAIARGMAESHTGTEDQADQDQDPEIEGDSTEEIEP